MGSHWEELNSLPTLLCRHYIVRWTLYCKNIVIEWLRYNEGQAWSAESRMKRWEQKQVVSEVKLEVYLWGDKVDQRCLWNPCLGNWVNFIPQAKQKKQGKSRWLGTMWNCVLKTSGALTVAHSSVPVYCICWPWPWMLV